MSILFPIVATVASLAVIVGGILWIRSGNRSLAADRKFVRQGLPATGTTVDLVAVAYERPNSDIGSPTDWYKVTVEFTTQQGRFVRATSINGSYPPPFKVGASTPLIYDPHNPERFMVISRWSKPEMRGKIDHLGGCFTVVFGGLAALFSVFIWWFWITVAR